MTYPVSVVIPTVGRPSLVRAMRSALAHTAPILEIIVVVDSADDVHADVANHPRTTLLRTPFRGGPGLARQVGIDAAHGSVIAMLDDDDEWLPTKLERQLQAVGQEPGNHWVCSSRMSVHGPGSRRRVWPRRLIEPGQSVTDYLFRFTDFRAGGGELQSSTLLFPTELARSVRWDVDTGGPQDEPAWLIRLQRTFPELRLVQLPDALTVYHVQDVSLSRQPSDRTDAYIEWGLEYLASEPARVLGDYLCTSPVSAAVFARSLPGVGRSVRAALRHGRPGGYALGYAAVNAGRIVAASLAAAVRS